MANGDAKPAKASFPQFINGFGLQALIQLGKIANPATGETRRDLPAAKYSIDMLGIIQEKTKGNLAPDEEENLAGILRDLRLAYVEADRREKEPPPAAPPAGQASEPGAPA
ncbi:MAG: DUF1844 domain-containing protein [Planctomycetota bacterium]|jgi:hypothetical protein|nr:DUF1844 domain-containing protein [Planctomycetota bacterium]